MRERIGLEEQALDSFGNFMFSIVMFWRVTGRWPERITVVSHEFKRRRFLDLHVRAGRWPMERVEFLGIDPVYMIRSSTKWDERRAEEVCRGERERGYGAWREDLWGRGRELRGKRMRRNFGGVPQVLFEDHKERVRSRVKTSVVSWKDGIEEEVLRDEMQPWEVARSLSFEQDRESFSQEIPRNIFQRHLELRIQKP